MPPHDGLWRALDDLDAAFAERLGPELPYKGHDYLLLDEIKDVFKRVRNDRALEGWSWFEPYFVGDLDLHVHLRIGPKTAAG